MNEFQKIKTKINIEQSMASFYVLKDVFSFLGEKQKLNLIIYNKNLQKKFDINIKDYKRVSGIYIEGEKNGIGKEYKISTNIIIFEGEYLKGKRNGKGKEYYSNGKIKFEGEYLKGKRNGKGKEYNSFGKLKFEGEYLKGKRKRGKEFHYNGKLKFEREYVKGKEMENGKNIILMVI